LQQFCSSLIVVRAKNLNHQLRQAAIVRDKNRSPLWC
jgi:hypothetical protein